MSPKRSSRASVGPPRRAQAKWTRPTGFAAVPPSGPATPVTLTATSAREALSAPSAIALAAVADCAVLRQRLGWNAEQFLFGGVGIDDEATLEHGRRAGNLGQKPGDQAAGAQFRRRGHEPGGPVAGDQRGCAVDEVGGNMGREAYAISRESETAREADRAARESVRP